ncbi:MAG: VWA domain-containing protein [Cytophagales bacterium]|nr:VWA domain-containing protein [Armatimonadota bacterium]
MSFPVGAGAGRTQEVGSDPGSALVPVPVVDDEMALRAYEEPDSVAQTPAVPRSERRSDDAASTGALTLRIRVGNQKTEAGDQTRQHVLTQIMASDGGTITGVPGANGARRMPVNIALVIDRSGSMEGEPLEYVKRACAYVVDLLGPEDILSIVTFEETVEVLMPARRVTDPALIKQHLQRILPGNTTNLFDGLYTAGAQVASVPNMGSYVSRVLLLTDGEPTAGLRDFPSIVGQVADLKQRGVTVTALGFGPDYNEELMAGIARRSGGNYYYIARPEEIPDVFRREIEQVLGVTARNPRLAFYLPRGCMVRQVLGSDPSFGTRIAEIALGDIERGATVSKLWEMELESRPAGTYRIARAVLTWEDGTTGRAETAAVNAVVEFVGSPDAATLAAGADLAVAQELAVAMASRDLEKTMMGMRTQQLDVADVAAALDRTQQLLKTQGRGGAADELAQAAQAIRRGAGGDAEKTLIGTIYHLDQGKRR